MSFSSQKESKPLIYALLAEPLRQLVGGHNQHKTDQTLEYADRGGEAVVRLLDPLVIHKGVERIADVHVKGVQLKEHLLEADLQHVAQTYDQHDYDRAADGGQRNMPDLAEAPCAVHDGRLVKSRVDACQRRQENNRSPAGFLPDDLQNQKSSEIIGLGEKWDRLLQAEQFSQHVVNQALVAEKDRHDADHHDPRQKMRHVNDGLQPSFQERICYLVQHDGQNDRRRKRERDLQKGNGQRIPDNLDNLRAFENPGKIRKTDPRTLREPPERAVFFKGKRYAQHGEIPVHDKVKQARQQQQV